MIFDGSFSLYEVQAFAKFRRKSARAQLEDCIAMRRKNLANLVYSCTYIDDFFFRFFGRLNRCSPYSLLPFLFPFFLFSLYSRPRSQRTSASCTLYYLQGGHYKRCRVGTETANYLDTLGRRPIDHSHGLSSLLRRLPHLPFLQSLAARARARPLCRGLNYGVGYQRWRA